MGTVNPNDHPEVQAAALRASNGDGDAPAPTEAQELPEAPEGTTVADVQATVTILGADGTVTPVEGGTIEQTEGEPQGTPETGGES